MYYATNEDLDDIVKRLRPCPEDIILAICGSGDQVFALAQYGPRVIAVDHNPEQITLAKQRAQALARDNLNGDYGFCTHFPQEPISDPLRGKDIKSRNQYFEDERRYERIKENLDNITFIEGNFFEVMEREVGKYNKVYLSNASPTAPPFRLGQRLGQLQPKLTQRVLIYEANGEKTIRQLGIRMVPNGIIEEDQLNHQLTAKAWQPASYYLLPITARLQFNKP